MSEINSSDVAWEFQKAIYKKLQDDSALQEILGNPVRIYDLVPEGATFPYVTISDHRVIDWPGVSGGIEHDLRLQVWSQYGGQQEVKRIIGLVTDALHQQSLEVKDANLINLRFVFADSFRQRPTGFWQGVLRFRAVTQSVMQSPIQQELETE